MSTLFDQVKTALEGFAATWKTNDGKAVASHFAEDGSLINPFGQRADGRANLTAMYAEYFGGMLRGTTTVVSLKSVRAVESLHAFADADQTVYGADGKVLLSVHVSALLRREGDTWRLVDSRPYTYATRPA